MENQAKAQDPINQAMTDITKTGDPRKYSNEILESALRGYFERVKGITSPQIHIEIILRELNERRSGEATRRLNRQSVILAGIAIGVGVVQVVIAIVGMVH